VQLLSCRPAVTNARLARLSASSRDITVHMRIAVVKYNTQKSGMLHLNRLIVSYFPFCIVFAVCITIDRCSSSLCLQYPNLDFSSRRYDGSMTYRCREIILKIRFVLDTQKLPARVFPVSVEN
jgi:hypothetical protein